MQEVYVMDVHAPDVIAVVINTVHLQDGAKPLAKRDELKCMYTKVQSSCSCFNQYSCRSEQAKHSVLQR